AVGRKNKARATTLSLARSSPRILGSALANRDVHHRGPNCLDGRSHSARVNIRQRDILVTAGGGSQGRVRGNRRIEKLQFWHANVDACARGWIQWPGLAVRLGMVVDS